eukprot:scaffold14730_cov78-Skeletonema_dohrnii-CCMP3373.AAC.3
MKISAVSYDASMLSISRNIEVIDLGLAGAGDHESPKPPRYLAMLIYSYDRVVSSWPVIREEFQALCLSCHPPSTYPNIDIDNVVFDGVWRLHIYTMHTLDASSILINTR